MKKTDVSESYKDLNYQELIDALQSEVDFYKAEHESLRKEVISVAEVNKELGVLLQNRAKLNENGDLGAYKSITNQIIQNFKNQVQLLHEEKTTFQNLWRSSQQTVASLELEIKEYMKQFNDPSSIFQIKRTYTNAIKILENKVSSVQHEMKDSKTSLMNLEESKRLCEQTLIDLDMKHNELLAEHNELLAQLKRSDNIAKGKQNEFASILRENERLGQEIAISKSAQKAYRIREAMAYAKIQEAIGVAEAAITEKNAAVQREKDIKDERDQLAINISEVMEVAGSKVESNVDGIRHKHNEKIQALRKSLLEATGKFEAQAKRSAELERSVATLEAKIKELHRDNQNLDADLQMASKTIIELEIKLQAYDKLIAKEQEISSNDQHQTSLLRDFYDTNKKLKEKWKTLYDEMTDKLQSELKNCQAENATFKIENLQLKSAVMQLEANQRNEPIFS